MKQNKRSLSPRNPAPGASANPITGAVAAARPAAKRPLRSSHPSAHPPLPVPAPAPRFYYKGSRLRQLRAFCMSAKLGTLSRAAEALFLSQPSVSLQIAALERDYGKHLMLRTGRRVTLSQAGEMLYELALPLIEGLDQLDQQFKGKLQGLAAGELNIAAGSSTIHYLLPALVQAFRAKHPEVRLQLHNVTGSAGLDLLRSDQVDFAVGSMLDVANDLAW